jgi:hypothetical protein
MPPVKKNKKRTKSRSKQRSVARLGKSFVTSYEPSINFFKRIRYYASAGAFSSGIEVNDILDTLAMMASSVSAYRLCSAVRVVAVKATVMPTFQTTADTTNTPVVFQVYTSTASLFGGPVRVHTLNNYGSVPSSCHLPLEGALCTQWFNNGNTGTTKLFEISVATAAVYLDVSFEFVLLNPINSIQPATLVNQMVSGTVGQVVICPLDGNTNGNLVPLLYTSA